MLIAAVGGRKMMRESRHTQDDFLTILRDHCGSYFRALCYGAAHYIRHPDEIIAIWCWRIGGPWRLLSSRRGSTIYFKISWQSLQTLWRLLRFLAKPLGVGGILFNQKHLCQ